MALSPMHGRVLRIALQGYAGLDDAGKRQDTEVRQLALHFGFERALAELSAPSDAP